MKADLEGLRCVVTGGGTGIGAGIARVLAGRGARVAVLGRRKKPLDDLVASLQVGKADALAVVGDVTDAKAMQRAVSSIAAVFGGLDVLVANAGIGGTNACALPGPDRWHEIVRTNLDGVYHSTIAALPHLADGGRVVTVSSVLGRFGVPGCTAYCASKFAREGFA